MIHEYGSYETEGLSAVWEVKKAGRKKLSSVEVLDGGGWKMDEEKFWLFNIRGIDIDIDIGVLHSSYAFDF